MEYNGTTVEYDGTTVEYDSTASQYKACIGVFCWKLADNRCFSLANSSNGYIYIHVHAFENVQDFNNHVNIGTIEPQNSQTSTIFVSWTKK